MQEPLPVAQHDPVRDRELGRRRGPRRCEPDSLDALGLRFADCAYNLDLDTVVARHKVEVPRDDDLERPQASRRLRRKAKRSVHAKVAEAHPVHHHLDCPLSLDARVCAGLDRDWERLAFGYRVWRAHGMIRDGRKLASGHDDLELSGSQRTVVDAQFVHRAVSRCAAAPVRADEQSPARLHDPLEVALRHLDRVDEQPGPLLDVPCRGDVAPFASLPALDSRGQVGAIVLSLVEPQGADAPLPEVDVVRLDIVEIDVVREEAVVLAVAAAPFRADPHAHGSAALVEVACAGIGQAELGVGNDRLAGLAADKSG